MIEVVSKHWHKSTPDDIYIGRGSALGNPYTSKDVSKTKAQYQCASVEESIEKFREHLMGKINDGDPDVINAINEICSRDNANLVCFCKPRACHGDVIKEICDLVISERKK